MTIVIIVFRAAIRIQFSERPFVSVSRRAMAVRIADTHSGRVPLPGVLVYAYWRDWQHDGRMGVLVLNSTGASNRAANDLREYECFFLPHAGAYSPMGSVRHHGGMSLGLVKAVFPQMQPRNPGDHSCIYQIRGAWYKGVFGYNAQNAGTDGIHHCVDAYFQGPINESRYNWYLLVDVYDPVLWYMATEMRVHGMRDLGMPCCTVPPPPPRI